MSVVDIRVKPELVFDSRNVYGIANPFVTANGQPVQLFAGNYYCNARDIVQLQGSIVDGDGNVVVGISIPVTVKLPLVKHVNGKPFANEIYLNVTIQNGVITATGEIESSGDWKIMMERVNEALKRIGADWKLSADDITFLA